MYKQYCYVIDVVAAKVTEIFDCDGSVGLIEVIKEDQNKLCSFTVDLPLNRFSYSEKPDNLPSKQEAIIVESQFKLGQEFCFDHINNIKHIKLWLLWNIMPNGNVFKV